MHRIFALFAVLIMPTALLAESVGWRTDGDGRYLDAAPPINWSPEQGVAWKTAMPSWSNASPVLLPGSALLFVCSEPDQLLAVDRTTGAIAWRQWVADVVGAKKVGTHDANGYTSTTPVVQDEVAYLRAFDYLYCFVGN